jgi:hypothetical protein
MNPETKYTNYVRKLMKTKWPDMVTVKHSDRFHGGVADLHATRSNALTIWIEFKYLPTIAKKRKSGLTELQRDYLLEHWERGVPAYVLIGTDRNKGHMLYTIDAHDGYAYRADILNNTQLLQELRWTK